MDRGISRSTSTPYLPRYQSLSPARSPQLGGRRFTSLRSVSQPSQRIYYIDSVPTRVINTYHAHHSPSPKRTYKIHLFSFKTNQHLTRVTRSRSAYDINSSHLYTSQEDISYKPFKEAAARRVGSCEDIYHKATFFPDITPSESGVSFGESEEGSAFGGEDDNVSQQSFDSSGAYYEVTMDSELDKCDSDNFSGPDYAGDRSLGILRENYQDEISGRRQREYGQSVHGPESSDSFTSLLSRVESKARESASKSSWGSDKFHGSTEALRVIIPDNESPAKTSKASKKPGDKRSSTPLAHSTPHVSPGGPDELKLHATVSWDADDPFGDVRGYTETRKFATAGAMFEPESESKLLFKLEDSSCASSCSEDNYSDVSNITISSQGSRKIKLVKKHSDKPASSKKNSLSNLPNLPGTIKTNCALSDNSVEAYQQFGNVTSENLSSEDSGCFTSIQSNSQSYTDQHVATDSVKYGEIISKDGKDWWDAYSVNTAREVETTVESTMCDNRDKLFSFQREIRVLKPLSVNIPLISAGKHGQEKLRQLSQTSQSACMSSAKSPSEVAQTWATGTNESQKTGDRIQANMDGQPGQHQADESVQVNHRENHKYNVGVEEKDRNSNFLTGEKACEQPVTSMIVSDNTQDGLSGWGIPCKREISHSEMCFESVPQECEGMSSERVGLDKNITFYNKDSEVAQIKGVQSRNSEENMKSKHDTFPSQNGGISCEIEHTLNDCTDFIINSNDESNWPVERLRDSGISLEKADSFVTEQVTDSVNVVNVSDVFVNIGASKPELGALSCSDELESSGDSLSETSAATANNAGLPALVSQVLGFRISDVTPRLAGKSNSDTSLRREKTASEHELSESEAHVTVLKENTSVHLDKNIVCEHLLGKANSASNNETEQEHFNVGLCSDSTNCSYDTDSSLVGRKSCSSDLNSFYSASAIGQVAGCIILKEVEQQQEQCLGLSFENTLTDCPVKTENTDMENLTEPGMRGKLSHAECRETPQMTVRVIATAQRTEDSIKDVDSPQHRNSWMCHHPTSSQLSSDFNSCSDRSVTNTVLSELSLTSTQDNINKHFSTNSDANKEQVHSSEKTRHYSRQQETLGTSVCTDIPRHVDESINGQGSVALRGDKGFNKDHFCTEKSARFVDRGEEFIHSPSVHEKVVIVTETIRQTEHIHRVTLETFVTNKQRINRSSLDFTFGGNCSVSDPFVTQPVVEEDKDSTIPTTDVLYSHVGKADRVTVSADRFYSDVNINTTSRLPTSSITITLSEPISVQRINESVHSSSSNLQPSSTETTCLATQIATPLLHSLNKERNDRDIINVSTDRLSLSLNKVFDTTSTGGELLAPETITASAAAAAMPRSDHLDSLQAQLSLISNDTCSTRLEDTDLYQDHAEATSVLKQIVRGHTTEFTQFSSTPSSAAGGDTHFKDSFPSHESSVTVSGELHNHVDEDDKLCEADPCQARESYDNDYDYVTTDLPKGSKSFPRPHHHPHHTKTGQFKTSSLWTLQEETESALSPRPSPKLPRVTRTSQMDNCSYQITQSPATLHADLVKENARNKVNDNRLNQQSLVYDNRALGSESSDFDDSDGNYSSISTPDSHRSSSFGREQTPLSEVELVAVVHEDDNIGYQDVFSKTDINLSNALQDRQNFVDKSLVSVPTTDARQGKSSVELEEKSDSASHSTTFRSNVTLSVGSSENKQDSQSTLDRLCASLEQFTESSSDGWRLILVAENATTIPSDSRESDMSTSSAHVQDNSDDDTVSETSWQHNLDFDTSRGSLTSTNDSEGSMFTSTVRAEIKKTTSYYGIPTSTTETTLNQQLKGTPAERHQDKVREEKIKQFENLLDEFSKSILPNAVVSEFIFLREKRTDRCESSSSSSSEDLYKSFTNEDSEKKQNHVCIVVEDENMNTFRFKRYLKKSHTKRKKGKKVLRFLSKLGCVSESLSSPFGSPNRGLKQPDVGVKVFSTDSMTTPKHTVSNPVMINSTSFRHQDISNTLPLGYTYNGSPSFSSNRSLDSIRSIADSAYSSISESVAGTLNSPASQRGPSTSFRVPPASSGSVSSVFFSGSTSGEWSCPDNVFSTSVDDFEHTSDAFSKGHFSHQRNAPSGRVDRDMMSSLSDVFDQLNVCEDEIDNALLNRIRHGHVKVAADKQ